TASARRGPLDPNGQASGREEQPGAVAADQGLRALQRERISYTPSQAAEATGMSRTRIFQALRDKELVGHKDRKRTLIEYDELRRWVRGMRPVGRASVAL